MLHERLVREIALWALRVMAGFLLVFWVAFWLLPSTVPIIGGPIGKPALLAAALASMTVSLGYLIFCAAERRYQLRGQQRRRFSRTGGAGSSPRGIALLRRWD